MTSLQGKQNLRQISHFDPRLCLREQLVKTLEPGSRIVKEFPGLSSSLTCLVENSSGWKIRKIAFGHDKEKLFFQYHWWTRFENLPEIPDVLGMRDFGNFLLVDLEYLDQATHFYDYIESSAPENSQRIFAQILQFVSRHIHHNFLRKTDTIALEKYLSVKLYNKVLSCIPFVSDLKNLLEKDFLDINGEKYANFLHVFQSLVSHQQIKDHLSNIYQTHLHGDLTIDNILVKEDYFYLLDPNNGNFLSTPVLDFAKFLQSLDSGYECVLRSRSNFERSGERFLYQIHRSPKYTELKMVFNEHMKAVLEETELPLLTFHHAVHLARLLPYILFFSEDAFWIFYCEMVKKLNEFIRSY